MSGVVLNTGQLIKRIKKYEHKAAMIWEGYKQSPDFDAMFEKIECQSPDELVEEIKEFASIYPASFTICTRKKQGGMEKKILCKWNSRTPAATPTTESGTAVNVEAEVERRMMAFMKEMKAEMQMNSLKAQLEMKDEQLKNMQSSGDKLAYVGLQMLQGWKGKPSANMQGFEEKNGNESKDMSGQTEPEDLSEEDKKAELEKLGKVWQEITAKFGPSTIFKFAEKCDNDEFVQMVKGFLN